MTNKINALLDKLSNLDLDSDIGIAKAKKSIRLALKGQDKQTRTACAATFNHICHTKDCPQNWEITAAIMNCKGGFK